MTFIELSPYSPGGTSKTIVVERITHWARLDYNGNPGTRIYLDTGAEVTTDELPHKVEEKINKALARAKA